MPAPPPLRRPLGSVSLLYKIPHKLLRTFSTPPSPDFCLQWEAGPHASWRGIDGPSLYFLRFAFLGVDFLIYVLFQWTWGDKRPRHSSPSGGTQEKRSRGSCAGRSLSLHQSSLRVGPPRSKRRCEAKPSRSTQIRDLTDECCGGPGPRGYRQESQD